MQFTFGVLGVVIIVVRGPPSSVGSMTECTQVCETDLYM